jgi:hypothetical protein
MTNSTQHCVLKETEPKQEGSRIQRYKCYVVSTSLECKYLNYYENKGDVMPCGNSQRSSVFEFALSRGPRVPV